MYALNRELGEVYKWMGEIAKGGKEATEVLKEAGISAGERLRLWLTSLKSECLLTWKLLWLRWIVASTICASQ